MFEALLLPWKVVEAGGEEYGGVGRMYRQDESIYALIPPEEMEQKKPPM